MQINHSDLKYFVGCALTGLLANPQYSTINGQKYLQMKKLTIEALAVESALEVMEVMSRLEEQLAKTVIEGDANGTHESPGIKPSSSLEVISSV